MSSVRILTFCNDLVIQLCDVRGRSHDTGKEVKIWQKSGCDRLSLTFLLACQRPDVACSVKTLAALFAYNVMPPVNSLLCSVDVCRGAYISNVMAMFQGGCGGRMELGCVCLLGILSTERWERR